MPTVNEESIFAAALAELAPGKRVALLDQACAGDAVLRSRVEALLRAHDNPDSALEAPFAGSLATAALTCLEGPGTSIGPYRLLEEIGEGGFGIVFLADQQKPIRRRVALKVIKPGMDTRQVIARFEAERQALALMDHPNIAHVIDGGETAGGRPYFVMELVQGTPLTDYCDQARLAPRQRLELFVTICQAVQHAHQKGIIHRDLKPSNVLVTPHDDTPVVKVIDFGIAKAIWPQLTDRTPVTGFDQMIGTPLYMSPEQAGPGSLDVDTRSDIYSLGVLLYELLTGTTPLEKERLKEVSYDEIRRIIREEEPARPSTRLSSLGAAATTVSVNRQSDPKRLSRLLRGELDWIVMKALEKDRNRRYETASGLAMDVQRYLDDEPVQACPPSAWYRLRKFARRHRVASRALACVAAVCLLAAGSLWYERHRRLEAVAQQVRDSLSAARALLAENHPRRARQQLAEAEARLTTDRASLGHLAEEVDALAAALNRFEEFFQLINRGYEKLIPAPAALALLDNKRSGHEPAGPTRGRPADGHGGDPARAVPLYLEALSRYGVLEREDWCGALEDGALGPHQVTQVRRAVYETLLWLADDTGVRREDHGPGRNKLSPQSAARKALAYLARAEQARPPTPAFYRLRARFRLALSDNKAARADERRARQTPATMAVDHYLMGRVAYLAGNKAEGVKQFEAALRLEPGHYWSLLWLGDCLCDLGEGPEDFAAAVGIYTGCIGHRPRHANAYLCRGNANRKLGRYEQALADHSRAIDLDPKYAAAWNNRGMVYINLGKYKKALGEFSRAIDLNPQLAGAWQNRGTAYSTLGQYRKALVDLSQVIKLFPNFQPAWNNRGLTYLALHRYEQALGDFSRAIALGPNDAMARTNRGLAHVLFHHYDKALADLSWAVKLGPKDARAWTSRGLAHAGLREYEKAVADHTQAIALNPKFAQAWDNRGLAHAELGQHEKAVADYSQAIALDLNNTWFYLRRAASYFPLHQYEKAVADYLKAVDLDRKCLEAWLGLSTAYTALQQYDKAIDAANKGIGLRPGNAAAHYNLGCALQAAGKYAEAEKAFGKAIHLKKNFPEAHLNLGGALMRQAKFAAAETAFRQAILLRQNSPQAHHNLGAALQAQGKLRAAVAAFRQAILLRPDFAEAHDGLGNALRALGKHAEAEAAYRESLRLRPRDAPAYYNLGCTLQVAGKYAEAEAEFRAAIRLRPDYAKAHCNLAHALRSQGRFAESLAAYKRGHELGRKHPGWNYPSGQWVREAQQLVALDALLSGVDKGAAKPTSAGEYIVLAQFCLLYKKRFAAAARFYEQAFAPEPKLAEDLKKGHRYGAACAAALAAAGQGTDAARLTGREQARLRKQALAWLRADLEAWGKLLKDEPDKARAIVLQQMRHWLADADLAGVRGKALAKLPEAERRPWQKLWAGVANALARAQGKKALDEQSKPK
jgi:tetratricopeptide (TPR) repeat protein/serine/threonine protein kinase